MPGAMITSCKMLTTFDLLSLSGQSGALCNLALDVSVVKLSSCKDWLLNRFVSE
jgi:hypothetical protein